jgi:hypothetical protein
MHAKVVLMDAYGKRVKTEVRVPKVKFTYANVVKELKKRGYAGYYIDKITPLCTIEDLPYKFVK